MAKQWTFRMVQEQVIVPKVEPASVTPLLSPTEEKDLTPTVTPSSEPDFRQSIGVTAEDEGDEGVCDVVELGNDEGPGYVGGRNLDADETPYSSKASSGYEKRERVLVDVGPDEQAEGYRGVEGGTGIP